MNQIVLLIVSLLSSSFALDSATNNEQKFVNSNDGLRVSKRESPIEQLFPSLRLNRLQNGSIFMHEITSAINYANSTIRKAIEETQNLFNLTADQYNPDEMTVIMAFPMFNNSLHSNESLPLNNSSSNGNSSYDLNEVKDGPNFSPRFLDLNEMLSLLQKPLNLLSEKFHIPTTPPVVVVEPTDKAHEEYYPAVPVVPVVPVVPYAVPEAPYVTYEEPKAPINEPAPAPAPAPASASASAPAPAKAEVAYNPPAAPYN